MADPNASSSAPASMLSDEAEPVYHHRDTADTTKRVLFGHLPIEDAPSAVARRIRTAIGLGVLKNGEKLPKEMDLARQFGVTAFSLREALGILRGEGLIVTRVGKNGGSFVEPPPPGGSMAGDELVRLTATELRDLGDWRTALTTYGAWLAAQRGSDETADQLSTCADEMATAKNSASARRALGRFHVELSAAAQSMRLTRAELVVHEEFDWLVQVLLQERSHCQAIAEAMRAVASDVRAGDAAASWRAGERMVSYLLTELTRARLQLIASRYAQNGRTGRSKPRDLTSGLTQVFDRLVPLLENVATDVAAAFHQSPTTSELTAKVARSVLPRLAGLDEIVHGLGFMAQVGVVPGSQYWVQWWQRSADTTFDRDYSHQLDPTRDDFYDYAAKGYMTRPRETGRPSAFGPYIDHGGVDDYLITVSVPVVNGETFVGIIAADIRVASLERAVSRWLAQAHDTCVLLNSDSRVVLSNSVRYNVGDVLPDDEKLLFTDVARFGWAIGRGELAVRGL